MFPRTSALRAATAGATLLVAVAATASYAEPGHGKKTGHDKAKPAASADFCTGGGPARPLELTVEGQRATGLYAVPKGKPKGLVVFTHGYGHTAESWRNHITNTAARNNVIAVVMNYRGEIITPPDRSKGETRPKSRGWQVAEGAADSNAAAQLVERRCKGLETIVLWGVSMGGNTAGLALAAKPTRTDGRPLYDYWFQMEGAANVIETYLAARALAGTGNATAVNAVEDIEREMGGPIETKRDVYLERTVVNRVGDIAQSGVKGIVMMHGAGDGLVPYNQSRELQTRLAAAGMLVEMHTFTLRESSSEPGTTIDSYIPNKPQGYSSPLSGHASEASETHEQNVAGFNRLAELFKGRVPVCAEVISMATPAGTNRTFAECT